MDIHPELQGRELLDAWAEWRRQGRGLEELAESMGLSYGSLRGRIKRARLLYRQDDRPPATAGGVSSVGDDNHLELTAPKSPRIRTLEDLLTFAEVDLTEWEVERYLINKWEVGAVVAGEVIASPLFQVKAWLAKKNPVINYPVIQPVSIQVSPLDPAPGPAARPQASTKPHTGLPGYALIIPDLQTGFRRDPVTGCLDPFHDRAAMDVVLQVAQEHAFDTVVLLGDLLDLPEWSDRFVRSPDMYLTTQPAVIELAWWLGRLRSALPHARIIALEGNHDERIPRAINANLAGAYQLRPAAEALLPPAISVPRLLGFHQLGIEWMGGYPNNEVWLNPLLKLEHGEKARGGPGETARAMVAEAVVSRVFGHIHREEVATRTLIERQGARTIRAVSPGCLCRIDGVVPGHVLGQNWSQGFAVAHYEPDGWHTVDVIPIVDGRSVYGVNTYRGRDMVDYLRKDTGWDTF